MKTFVLLGIVALVAGCPAGFVDVCDDGVCEPRDASTDTSADVTVDAPPGCDLAKDPKDSPLCIADSVGIFVDATKGDDATGDGSKAKPVKTIGKALEKAGNKPRIYICEGTYAEDVVLDATHAASLVGGLRCGDWTYSGVKPVVGKGTLALKIDSVTSALMIADLAIKSGDAAKPGESSVAAFVNGSDKVSFVRTKFEAGIGAIGSNGIVTNVTYPTQGDLNGKSASGMTGGAANAVTCTGGKVSTGGKGGNNGFPGDDGLPSLGAGQGGTAGSCGGTGTGKDGTPAIAAATGDGAKALGLVDTTGWKPAAGLKGTDAAPGQGGGGGFGSGGGAGGGGGSGGCGGAGGGSGMGGGGSIALVSAASTVSIAGSEFIATTSGDGGNGTAGQTGQNPGGFGGIQSPPGCPGGAGGAGGAGGSGGGGAGGLSVGILWKGTAAPTVDASTTAKITVAAKGGTKGTGGTPGTNDGIDGVAQAALEVK